MPSIDLDLYGARLRLTSESGEIIEELRRDFAFFLAPPAARQPLLHLDLKLGPSPRATAWPITLWTRGYRVVDRWPRRWVRYRDGAMAEIDATLGRGTIWADSLDRLHELGYLCALSRAGEELDSRGLHRVHALGFSWGGQGGLLLLSSGGGKTTLALELSRLPGFSVLSDDTPLLTSDLTLRAFPLRLAFRSDADLSGIPAEALRPFRRLDYGDKSLLDAEFLGRPPKSVPLRWLLLGRRGQGPSFERAGKGETLISLGLNLVVGWGVPQMAEFRLRPLAFRMLARAATSRARLSLRALEARQAHRFVLGGEPRLAAEALRCFVGGTS